MSEALETHARQLLSSTPASVELPAGTGKTQLLAATVLEAAEQGLRSLILTHTNAGVDVIRKRLTKFRVSPKFYVVETITGWAFKLARSYQVIAEVVIPDAPIWNDSNTYLRGAIRVANAAPLQKVLSLSYDCLLVDEYQDCTLLQHEFILALRNSIPRTIVFGDPLQSIFRFRDNTPIEWAEVSSIFPPHFVEPVPHRWASANPELGKFTLDIRQKLQRGGWIDFDGRSESGVLYVPGAPSHNLVNCCRSLANSNGTVAVLTKWPSDEDRIARSLGGRFNVIEPINGRRIEISLDALPEEGDPLIAKWFADTAKTFHVGLGGIDRPLLSKLAKGESVADIKRQGLQDFIDVLAKLQNDPSYNNLLEFQKVPYGIEGVRCSNKEAWSDTFRAIQYAVEENAPDVLGNLALIRSRYKHIERQMPRLVISRPVIIKGLEFDHVIIADIEDFSDPCDLYVALSRARESVTVLGRKSAIRLRGAD